MSFEPPRLHRSRARSRSPTATSPEARTCPIRVPCHHAAIHSSAEQDYRAPFNRARVHWISAKARVAAFVHVCSPTATRFSPTPPSFSCSCSSSCSFSIPYRHQPGDDSGCVWPAAASCGSPSPGVIEASGAPLEPPSGGAVKPVFQELNLRLILTLRSEFSEV